MEADEISEWLWLLDVIETRIACLSDERQMGEALFSRVSALRAQLLAREIPDHKARDAAIASLRSLLFIVSGLRSQN